MDYFICENCGAKVKNNDVAGIRNRNHCPKCLFSKHLDIEAGDRKSQCKGLMKPIALTFKKMGKDKFGKEKIGELMMVHECKKCGHISINRLAGDDNTSVILKIYNESHDNGELATKLKNIEIVIAYKGDKDEVEKQILGKLY